MIFQKDNILEKEFTQSCKIAITLFLTRKVAQLYIKDGPFNIKRIFALDFHWIIWY